MSQHLMTRKLFVSNEIRVDKPCLDKFTRLERGERRLLVGTVAIRSCRRKVSTTSGANNLPDILNITSIVIICVRVLKISVFN